VLDVVIYEEDQLTSSLLQEWLQQAGYRPRSETTCSAGRDLTADLIVLSIRNPKQRGGECVNAIRAAHPGKPIIAISGQFRLGVPAEGDVAKALGVQRVMAKPLLREDLLKAVRALIGPGNGASDG
jgi:DNA-binding response OmpR family regulator